MEVAALGLRVDGSPVDKAAASLDRLSGSAERAERSAEGMGKGADRAGKQAESSLKRADLAGRAVAKSFGLITTALAAAASGFTFGRLVSETAGFEQSLLGLQVVSGATAAEMQQLEQQSRTLGATSMFSAQQAADAQNFLAMAGFSVNETLGATPGILQLAAAGSMDLASAADLASNVLGGFRLEVEELGRVNDVLAAAAAGSNTSIMQLGQAMSFAAPIAAAAGVSIEGTAAAIGVLSDAGLQGSRAGTGFLGVIRQLSNLTPAATSALSAYGLTAEDVNIETRGLAAVVEALNAANIDAADSFKIFGSEAGPAAQILASGAMRVNEFTGELELAEGTAQRAALILGSGLQGSMKSFASAVGESTLQLGRDSGLSAGLQDVIDTATGVISVYNDMLPEFAEANDLSDEQARNLEAMAGTLSAASGAAVALAGAYGAVTVASGAATVATRALTAALRVNPLVAAASAIVAIAGALYGARNAMVEFGDTTASVGNWVAGVWNGTNEFLEGRAEQAWDAVGGSVSVFAEAAGGVFSYLWGTFQALMDNIVNAAKVGINGVIAYFLTLQDVGRIVTTTLYDQFTGAFDRLLSAGRAFWTDLTNILAGDFSFSNLAREIETGFVNELASAGQQIRDAFSENFSRDFIGETVDFAGEAFTDLGDHISDAAFRARFAANDAGEAAKGFGGLGEEAEGAADGLDRIPESASGASQASRDAEREAERFASALQALQDQLFPVEAAQREYAEQQAALTRGWNEGTISAERYTEAMRRLEEAQLSQQTPGDAYGGGGFGSQIGDPISGMGGEGQGFWDQWLESAQTALTDFDSLAASTAENFQQGFGQAFEAMIFDSESLRGAIQGLAEGMSRAIVSALGEMAAQWLAYQAVQLLVGRTGQSAASAALIGNAQAGVFQAGINAFASTAAIPIVGPALAPGAMAAAISATQPLAAAVQTSALAGMAHDGIDSVPKTGTWLLEQGERVTTSQTSARLDATLDRIDKQGRDSGGGGTTVNIIESRDRAGERETTVGDDGREQENIFVADLYGDGPRSRAMQQVFGLQRLGR